MRTGSVLGRASPADPLAAAAASGPSRAWAPVSARRNRRRKAAPGPGAQGHRREAAWSLGSLCHHLRLAQKTERATRGGRPFVHVPMNVTENRAELARFLTGLDGQRFQVDRLLFQDSWGLLPLLFVVVEPGPGGDELADDHVLLQAPQPVDLARDRGLGQDARGLLEGSCREPR